MIYNYIKSSFRNLRRFKVYTLLNLIGLSIGLALGIFSMLYFDYIYGYNQMMKDRDHLFKLICFTRQNDDTKLTLPLVSALTPALLLQEVPEIKSFNRYIYTNLYLKNGNESLSENGLLGDDNFFDFYTFPLIQGNSKTLLQDPGSIVISQNLATKLFNNQDPVGKTISALNNNKPVLFTVSGVFKNVEHASLHFDFVLPLRFSLASRLETNPKSQFSVEVICHMQQGADIARINKRIKGFLDKTNPENIAELFLHPLAETDLYYYQNGNRQMGKLLIVVIMGIIGGLILLIAAFNYFNMTIAIGIRRNKESAIRKMMGAQGKNILGQYLVESVILSWMSLFLAFILLETMLPFYNRMDQIHLVIPYNNIWKMSILFGYSAFVGIISALYPAIKSAALPHLRILKGWYSRYKKIGISRQGFIVFQFTITILLLCGLFIISRQAGYILHKETGMDRNNIIFFKVSKGIMDQKSAFVTELNTLPEISAISWCSENPIFNHMATSEVTWDGKPEYQKNDFWVQMTDTAFQRTFRVKMEEGRFFSAEEASDSGAFIINEEAVHRMNIKNPVGQTLTLNQRKGIIVGVVRNYNFMQLQAPILPLIICNDPALSENIFIRFMGDPQVIRDKITKLYKKYETYIPIYPELLDDSFQQLHIFAQNASLVLLIFSILALILSCMGLYGLASFTIETRTKEIGIRKANGANSTDILKMFLMSYGKWIFIASGLAIPLSYLLWNPLLSSFFLNYTSFSFIDLILPPILILLIAWGTVIGQSWRASSKNPVEALRYE